MGKDDVIWFDVDAFSEAMDGAVGEMRKIVKAAIYSTVGKVRRHARTQLSTLIREKWNIKKKDLDGRIRVRVGERGDGYESFEMTIRGMSISMAYFKGTVQIGAALGISAGVGQSDLSVSVSRGKGGAFRSIRGKRSADSGGVQVQVIKGRKKILPRAWLHFAPSGHVTVLQRRGKKRTPVRVKAAISPASMFSDATTADRFEEDIISFLERTFEHELSWRMQQAGLA